MHGTRRSNQYVKPLSLLILLATVLLTFGLLMGCSTDPVRVPCPSLPTVPSELMAPAKNADLTKPSSKTAPMTR